MSISQTERDTLRRLAARQREAALSPRNLARIEQWKQHNACAGAQPIVHVELDTFEHELVTPLLTCTDPVARALETDLYRAFYNLTTFDDDWVVPDYFGVRVPTWFHPFGHEVARKFAHNDPNAVGHQFEYVLSDLEEDWDKLGPSRFGFDREAADRYAAAAEEAFGDLLPVRRVMNGLYAVPTQHIIHLMGMENMCFAMYDYPELFLKMMDQLADDYLAFFELLTREGLLLPTTGHEGVAQGSRCFTSELPEHPTSMGEVWGFLDSQETVSISPEMFGELVFPCYEKIGTRYGLLSYGCCEPVDRVWEYVRRFSNLRKVSISPWCDEAFMGEQLRGTNIIYQRKPSPNFLGVGDSLDEDGLRRHIRATLDAAAGCTLEFTQRDVYTVGSDPERVHRYVEIVRDEIDRHWKG